MHNIKEISKDNYKRVDNCGTNRIEKHFGSKKLIAAWLLKGSKDWEEGKIGTTAPEREVILEFEGGKYLSLEGKNRHEYLYDRYYEGDSWTNSIY